MPKKKKELFVLPLSPMATCPFPIAAEESPKLEITRVHVQPKRLSVVPLPRGPVDGIGSIFKTRVF